MASRLAPLLSLVPLAACGLAGGCGEGRAGVLLELSAESDDARPDHVLIRWTASDGMEIPEYRLPPEGKLAGEGTDLGSVFVDLAGQPAGMRTVTLLGMRGQDVFSRAMQSVNWAGARPASPSPWRR